MDELALPILVTLAALVVAVLWLIIEARKLNDTISPILGSSAARLISSL